MYLCTTVFIYDDLSYIDHGQILCNEGSTISVLGLFYCSMFMKIMML